MKIETKKGYLPWSWPEADANFITAKRVCDDFERSIILRASDWKHIKRVLDAAERNRNKIGIPESVDYAIDDLYNHLDKMSAKK